MRRIDRYILSEIAVPATIGGLLVLVLLTGNWLYSLIKYLYNGVNPHDVLLILAYRLPSVLMLAIPASLMLGTALALSRLERDRELMSLRMCGVRLKRLVLPLILFALAWSVGMFALQETVIPRATHAALKLTRKVQWGTPEVFIERDVILRAGQMYLYVREVDPKNHILRGVIATRMGPGYPMLLTAPIVENRDQHWLLKPDPYTKANPTLYYFKADGTLAVVGTAIGEDNVMNLTQEVWTYMSDQPSTPEELTLKQLANLRNGVRGPAGTASGSLPLEPKQLTFHVHRKFAAPLAALVGVLIAIPLSVHFGRSGGYVGLLLSVVVAFSFVVSQQWAQALVETDRLQPILAAWAPDALFGLLGIVLLFMEE
ncbi:MAG TPA: LptF/LptG family permease [Armatimonadota bacterium]|jgi:lipopolysaccharide export LptBFGC system permease protein LptF